MRSCSGEVGGWRHRSTWGRTGVLLLMVVAVSCTPKVAGVYENTRATIAQVDDFGMLLLEAGLSLEPLPLGEVVTVEQAERLRMLLWLAIADGDMKRYGPRVTADSLLSEVVIAGRAMPRSSLNARLRKFAHLAVLRPDGYLAQAITGVPLQCVGPLQMQDNELQAGDFKVGPFYSEEGGSFRVEPSTAPRSSSLPGAETLAAPRAQVPSPTESP